MSLVGDRKLNLERLKKKTESSKFFQNKQKINRLLDSIFDDINDLSDLVPKSNLQTVYYPGMNTDVLCPLVLFNFKKLISVDCIDTFGTANNIFKDQRIRFMLPYADHLFTILGYLDLAECTNISIQSKDISILKGFLQFCEDINISNVLSEYVEAENNIYTQYFSDKLTNTELPKYNSSSRDPHYMIKYNNLLEETYSNKLLNKVKYIINFTFNNIDRQIVYYFGQDYNYKIINNFDILLIKGSCIIADSLKQICINKPIVVMYHYGLENNAEKEFITEEDYVDIVEYFKENLNQYKNIIIDEEKIIFIAR